MYLQILKPVALPVSEIIAIEFEHGGCEPQSWGRGGRTGSVWHHSKERWWVPIAPMVTFLLSLKVSDILPLLCSSTPLFPTPPLVSPKFPHVLLGVGGWPFGYEEHRCWAKCPCI